MTPTTNESQDTQIAVMATDIKYLIREVGEIKKKLEADYVTRQEFEPIKKFVYGLITIVLVGVIGAILTLVIKK